MTQRQDAPDGLQDRLVSEWYAQLEPVQPSVELDAAILAAARKEAGAGPRPAGTGATRQRWFIPLSTAAGLLLAVAIVWKMDLLNPRDLSAPVSIAVAPDAVQPPAANDQLVAKAPAEQLSPRVTESAAPEISRRAPGERVDATETPQKPVAPVQIARKSEEKQPVMMEQAEPQVVGSMAMAPEADAGMSETERALELAQAQLDRERRESVQSAAVGSAAPELAPQSQPADSRLPFPERFKQIRVGMERAQILSLLGRPKLHKPEWWEYHWMPQAMASAEPTVYRVYFDKQERLVRYEVTEGRQAPVTAVPGTADKK